MVEMICSVPVQKVREVEGMLKLAACLEEQSATVYNRWANEGAANAEAASKKTL